MREYLRGVPPTAWAFVMLTGFVLLLLGYLALFVYRASQPAVIAVAPYTTYPQAVCPGDLVIIEYRAVKLRGGNQNLVAVSNWYNPSTQTRYASSPSLYGAIFPEDAKVIRSLTEARVPQALPAGKNEYWRGILGQPGSLMRVTFEIQSKAKCPATELEDQVGR